MEVVHHIHLINLFKLLKNYWKNINFGINLGPNSKWYLKKSYLNQIGISLLSINWIRKYCDSGTNNIKNINNSLKDINQNNIDDIFEIKEKINNSVKISIKVFRIFLKTLNWP